MLLKILNDAANAAMNLAEVSCHLIGGNGAESADTDEAEILARKNLKILLVKM